MHREPQKLETQLRPAQRFFVTDFGVKELPSTFDRFTLLEDDGRDRIRTAITRASWRCARWTRGLDFSGSRGEPYRHLGNRIRSWLMSTYKHLRLVFSDAVVNSAPRVDHYAIDTTVQQMVRLGAFFAQTVREHLASSRYDLVQDEIDDLTRMAQEHVEFLLCLPICDFREWAELRRFGESKDSHPLVVLRGAGRAPIVNGCTLRKPLTESGYPVIESLLHAGPPGLTKGQLVAQSHRTDARGILRRLSESDPNWKAVILMPGGTGRRYRLRFE